MENHIIEWEVGKRAWRLFPRSAAVITLMIASAINRSVIKPDTALYVGIFVWIGFNILRWLMPDIYMRRIWYLVGFFIKAISSWPLRWLLVAIFGSIAVSRGMPPVDLFMVFILYIMVIIFEAFILR